GFKDEHVWPYFTEHVESLTETTEQLEALAALKLIWPHSPLPRPTTFFSAPSIIDPIMNDPANTIEKFRFLRDFKVVFPLVDSSFIKIPEYDWQYAAFVPTVQ